MFLSLLQRCLRLELLQCFLYIFHTIRQQYDIQEWLRDYIINVRQILNLNNAKSFSLILFCNVLGFGLLVFQLSLYPYVERLFGAIMVSRISGVSFHNSIVDLHFTFVFAVYIILFFHVFLDCLIPYAGFIHTRASKLPIDSHIERACPCLGVKLCFCDQECLICKCIYIFKISF